MEFNKASSTQRSETQTTHLNDTHEFTSALKSREDLSGY